MKKNFPKRPSDEALHTLSKSYNVPIGFVTTTPPHCFICGRRWVADARYRMVYYQWWIHWRRNGLCPPPPQGI